MRNFKTLTLSVLTSLVIVYASAIASAQQGGKPGSPPPPPESTRDKLDAQLGEAVVDVPVTVTGYGGVTRTGQMIVTIFKPQGDGPFPLVVFNHGRDPSHLADTDRDRFPAMAGYFVRRGFSFMVPTRLGYGATGQTPDVETIGNCRTSDYRPASDAVARSAFATIDYARTLPFIDAKRIIIAGVSTGGLGSIYAAGVEPQPDGVIAYVNFAGGHGGNPKSSPEKPCSPDALESLYREAGTRARKPTFWIYAQNDLFWGADLPRRWLAAFITAGGRAEFRQVAPVGENGHFILPERQVWRPPLDAFLANLGFNIPKTENPPPPTKWAAIDDAGRVPLGTDEDAASRYRRFLQMDVPRAFAVGINGHWAARSGPNAMPEALAACAKFNEGSPCHLYAVDDNVVWTGNE